MLIMVKIQYIKDTILKNYKPETYNRLLNRTWSHVSNYILHHYKLSNRTDTSFWKYYSKFTVEKYAHKKYNTKNLLIFTTAATVASSRRMFIYEKLKLCRQRMKKFHYKSNALLSNGNSFPKGRYATKIRFCKESMLVYCTQ